MWLEALLWVWYNVICCVLSFARYWQEGGVEYRNLYKAYGILFQVETVGQVMIFISVALPTDTPSILQGKIVSVKQIFISFGSGVSYLVLVR